MSDNQTPRTYAYTYTVGDAPLVEGETHDRDVSRITQELRAIHGPLPKITVIVSLKSYRRGSA